MKNSTRVIVKMASAAMVALLGLGVGARVALAEDSGDSTAATAAAPAHADSAGKHGHMTATVTTIDRTNRSVGLMNDGGERMIVHVPASMKRFDKIKEGDRVSVAYQQPIAVAILRPGDPSGKGMSAMAGKGTGAGAGADLSCAGKVGAMSGGTTCTTGNVVSVDADKGALTFRGPGGQVQTVTAVDPVVEEKLAGLHQGDLIQVSYTQPVAASIAPAPASK